MIDALRFEFMQNALAAALLASVALGIVGAFVVVNRQVFISGGIAHAAYGGIGIGVFFGFSPTLGALIFSAVAALLMGMVQRLARQRADTVIGVMWAVGMATGIVFIDRTPGYKADLMSFLFGSILAVPRSELAFMIVLDIIVVIFVSLYYRPLLAISFDQTFARVRNLPVLAQQLAVLLVVAITVVLLMRVVGLILVIAMLTMPAALSSQYVSTLKSMMVSSIVVGALFMVAGLWIAFEANLTSGATIILVSASGFAVGVVAKRLREWWVRRRSIASRD